MRSASYMPIRAADMLRLYIPTVPSYGPPGTKRAKNSVRLGASSTCQIFEQSIIIHSGHGSYNYFREVLEQLVHFVVCPSRAT